MNISKCDNCGYEDAFRVDCRFSTSAGERLKSKDVPKFDCDLCLDCFGRVAAAIKAIFPPVALKE